MLSQLTDVNSYITVKTVYNQYITVILVYNSYVIITVYILLYNSILTVI